MMDNNLEYYLNLPYTLEIREIHDELGHYFYGNYVELNGCESKGDTIEDLVSNMTDAKLAWISIRYERGELIPEPQSVYSGQLMLHLPRSLHQKLAIKARQEGISLNQYIIYKLS
ncbi:toxin-antitoxin system HicB family antitoxin [Paenibacillus tengchongensis]|uniref:toxin-antitoxin system HicB family antitoxin n=1 Tax=Paenibacillus tengchongensis TaxID=2608684 RepID=UPI00124DE990|nr:toxin-antitoxin system HicB family antitoxin [Paenibacillus tengchongensis]